MPEGGAMHSRRPVAGSPVALLLALLFVVLYAAFYVYLPKGRLSEFAYHPPGLFPFSPMLGFTVEQLLLHVGRMALLGPALAALSIALAGSVPPLPALEGRRARRLALAAGAVSTLLATLVMTRVLAGAPLVDDEPTYRNQAALLLEGKLADPTIPWPAGEAFTIRTRLGVTGKYLPGEPLVQTLGTLADLPGLLHLLLAALALVLWFRMTRDQAGEEVAAWATALLALSPMWVLTTATGMSHATSAFCVVAAAYGFHLAGKGREMAGALIAGTAIGFGLTVRLQVMLPIGAVIGIALAADLVRRRKWGAAAALGAAGGFWLAVIGGYNQLLTGSWLKLPWFLAYPIERYGFGPISDMTDALVHTPAGGVRNLLVSALRFNGWWLGLPLGLGVLGAWAAVGRPRAGLKLWGVAALALLAFNFFYYSPGVSDTGPVYYYELLFPASLLAAHTVAESRRRWPRATAAVVGVHLLLGTGTFLAEQTTRLARLSDFMAAPVREALRAVEPPALLIYETAPQEALHPGWVFSFPVRYRSDRDLVVTFPRGDAEMAASLRRRYAMRKCYYYHVARGTRQPQLWECEQAEELLARPAILTGRPAGVRPTSWNLGFVPDVD